MESKLTVYDNGTKKWNLPNGKLHREDGPAVEWSNGSKSWWLYGKEHTDKEYKVFTRSMKINKILGKKS